MEITSGGSTEGLGPYVPFEELTLEIDQNDPETTYEGYVDANDSKMHEARENEKLYAQFITNKIEAAQPVETKDDVDVPSKVEVQDFKPPVVIEDKKVSEKKAVSMRLAASILNKFELEEADYYITLKEFVLKNVVKCFSDNNDRSLDCELAFYDFAINFIKGSFDSKTFKNKFILISGGVNNSNIANLVALCSDSFDVRLDTILKRDPSHAQLSRRKSILSNRELYYKIYDIIIENLRSNYLRISELANNKMQNFHDDTKAQLSKLFILADGCRFEDRAHKRFKFLAEKLENEAKKTKNTRVLDKKTQDELCRQALCTVFDQYYGNKFSNFKKLTLSEDINYAFEMYFQNRKRDNESVDNKNIIHLSKSHFFIVFNLLKECIDEQDIKLTDWKNDCKSKFIEAFDNHKQPKEKTPLYIAQLKIIENKSNKFKLDCEGSQSTPKEEIASPKITENLTVEIPKNDSEKMQLIMEQQAVLGNTVTEEISKINHKLAKESGKVNSLRLVANPKFKNSNHEWMQLEDCQTYRKDLKSLENLPKDYIVNNLTTISPTYEEFNKISSQLRKNLSRALKSRLKDLRSESPDDNKRLKSHAKEIIAHLAYLTENLELFYRAYLKGDLFTLAAIIPFFFLDGHLLCEQSLKHAIVCKSRRKVHTHDLEKCYKMLGVEFTEIQTLFMDWIKDGMLQVRYPVEHFESNDTHFLIGSILNTRGISTYINSNQYGLDVSDLAEFLHRLSISIIGSYTRSLEIASVCAGIKIDMDENCKALSKAMNSVVWNDNKELVLIAQGFLTEIPEENEALEKLRQMLKQALTDDRYSHATQNLKEASGLISTLQSTNYLQHKYVGDKLAPMHERNLMMFAWIVEQLYRVKSIADNGVELRGHNLEEVHRKLMPDTPLPVHLKEFNIEHGVQYNSDEKSKDKEIVQNLSLTRKSQKDKESKGKRADLSEDEQKQLEGSFYRRKETMQRGLELITEVAELVLN